MSDNVENDSKANAQLAESIRVVNARIDKIERQQRQDEEEERNHNLSQLKVNRTIMVFTGLLFVTSAISDIYLIQQTGIARNSADAATSAATTANLAFMSDQWPYTVATQIAFAGGSMLGPVAVNIKLQNIGKSPAYKVTTYSKLSYLEYRNLSQDKANAKRESVFSEARSGASSRQSTSIAPTRDVMISTQDEVILTPPKIALITSNKAGLLLVAGVIYDDSFKVTHETQMCEFIEGKDFPIWHYCDIHNSIK